MRDAGSERDCTAAARPDACAGAAAPVQTAHDRVRGGSENNALDRAWLRLHAAGSRPALLRFWRSRPSASIGAFQAIDRELRVDHCRRRGIECLRRPGGGGALYLDPAQLGVSLVCPRRLVAGGADQQHLLARFCDAIAAGLRLLGVAAVFKAPNDLEVGGRKLACVHVAQEGDCVLLTAVVLMDADIGAMLAALKVPTEKLSADGLAAARDRVATLTELLGRAPVFVDVERALARGIAQVLALELVPAEEALLADAVTPGDLAAEAQIARHIQWDAGAGLEALWRSPGGTVRARGEIRAGCLSGVRFAGDFFFAPPAALGELEQALEAVPVARAAGCIEAFFQRRAVDATGLGPQDFARAVHALADQARLRTELGLSDAEAATVMLCGDAQADPGERLRSARVLLVPYCAKPVWCKWRTREDCPECGMCAVGEAYRLGRSRGLQVITVTRYEHLLQCFERMRADGVRSYLGMCCGNFFLKRFRAFREAGMDAILLDIAGANCYELGQEAAAYAGRFQAQAELELGALAKAMAQLPDHAADAGPASRRRRKRAVRASKP